jgi:hypothetical protein
LVLFFGWLELKDHFFMPAVESIHPEVLRKGTLAVYYASWIFGTNFDLTAQQAVYVKDPGRGAMSKVAIAALLSFAVVAAVLLWASDSDQRFAGALAIFLAANIAGWAYIVRRVKPIIDASGKYYKAERDFAEFERLHIVANYISGNWQWHRFAVMCVLVAIVLFACFTRAPTVIEALVRNFMSTLPSGIVSSLLPDLSLILFVLIAETWIWIMRARTQAFLNVIFVLKKIYRFTPR